MYTLITPRAISDGRLPLHVCVMPTTAQNVGIFDQIVVGVSFSGVLPKIDWDKLIQSTAINISIGVVNKLYILFSTV